MVLQVYSVFDIKAGNYATPFFMLRDQMAIRAISDATNNPKSTLNLHPGDYSLFHIGSYDDSSAELVSFKPKQILQCASIYVDPEAGQIKMPFQERLLEGDKLKGAPSPSAAPELSNGVKA